MKRYIRMAAALALVLTVFSAVAVNAQEVVDAAQLDAIIAAFEDTRAVSSLHLEAQSQTEISGLPAAIAAGMQNAEIFDLAKSGEVWNAAGTRTISVTLPTGAIEITAETVLLDGAAYVRLSGLPAEMGQNVPEGWFDTAALADDAGQVPFVNGADANLLLGSLGFPVNAESVIALSELAGDTIDGQAMRVFQLTLDPAAVLESDAAGLLNAGMGGGLFMGGPGQGGFPGGGDFTLPEGVTPPEGGTPPTDMAAPNPEDFQVTFAVYIGADDGLIHRVYSVIASAPADDAAQPFGLTMTTITNYSKFNEPVIITAPELPAS